MTRIRILGTHPWTGLTARLIQCQESTFRLAGHVYVRLEDGQPCPHGQKSWVQEKDVQFIR